MDVDTSAGTYVAHHAKPCKNQAPAAALSAELQVQLTDLEVEVSRGADRLLKEQGLDPQECLIVVDGPLRDRGGPHTLGFIKSHRRAHLPTEQHLLVGSLGPAERTPVFALGQGLFRRRYSWYLRLPCLPASPWSGVVRIEAFADLEPGRAIELADLSQRVLPRFGSVEYKDARAPQNLYPVAGLERELRRRLGEPQLLHRILKVVAHHL